MARILIVDDSETVRSQLRRDLESKGHTVFEAADGALGMEKYAEAGELGLIICDVNMPNMDGITMCAKLSEKGNKVPIFMLTTEGAGDMKDRAKAAGVKAWITKPYSADKLLNAVSKVV